MARLTPAALRCRRRFLEFFPDGFLDETYLESERAYKWDAHRRWNAELDRRGFEALLDAGAFEKIADHAIRVETRTNLLFSFEKMAIRDAVRSGGAQTFAEGLYDWLHGPDSTRARFDKWVATIDALPRRQTRVLTWPIVTVWGFIARPRVHIFLKPTVTRIAAEEYDVAFDYRSRPQWRTYEDLVAFATRIRDDQADLHPRDMIDVQSFIWVQGSAEYD